MTLAPGTRFGPYTVTSVLGAGGMGQVYRAHDARLGRDVALKVLPPDLTHDADRLARFKREAQVLAALNHANIAAIYGLEQGDTSGTDASPTDAIVLELVDGPTLAERLAAGPMGVEEARAVALQIAAALEAAHERGIVHRDLKPANVKVRPDGTVKVLDFGLAKAWEPPSAVASDVSATPTITSPARTALGIILGTAAYMSPEQARGLPVDKRADIWAFGCVLFEMLGGRPVFGRLDTVSDAIAAVLTREPDWAALPAGTPRHIRSLLKKCLEKDPRRRLRDMGDAALILGDDGTLDDSIGSARRDLATTRSRWVGWAAILGWTAAAVLGLAVTLRMTTTEGQDNPATPASVPLRLEFPLAASLAPGPLGRTFAVSSDGSRVVFKGRDRDESSLFLQDMTSGEIRRLPETAEAEAPAFSPDGRALGFTSVGRVKVLVLDGGLPREVQTGRFIDWTWSGSDHVVVASGRGLQRVPVAGGEPQTLATIGSGEALFGAVVQLPGGAYLTTVHKTTSTDDPTSIVVVTPGVPDRRVLVERGGSPTFVSSGRDGRGYVVYASAGRLMALPFDPVDGIAKGSPAPVVDNVAMRPNGASADYAVTASGTLVFREDSLHELVRVDRASGAIRSLSAHLRRFALPRLSPDQTRLVVEVQDSPHQAWLLDIERDVLTPLTIEPTGAHNFAWAPDGQSIVYALGNRAKEVGWTRTTGLQTTHRIAVPGGGAAALPEAWRRDGRLAFTVLVARTNAVMVGRIEDGEPPTLAVDPVRVADGIAGGFSPDGAWLSYCDCESAGERPPSVYIRHLDSGRTYQVSAGSGDQPVWAASGREIYYRAETRMMAVSLRLDGEAARIGRAETVFEGDYLHWGSPNFDVTADGKEFIMVRTAKASPRSLAVRMNWTAGLERLVPFQ